MEKENCPGVICGELSSHCSEDLDLQKTEQFHRCYGNSHLEFVGIPVYYTVLFFL